MKLVDREIVLLTDADMLYVRSRTPFPTSTAVPITLERAHFAGLTRKVTVLNHSFRCADRCAIALRTAARRRRCMQNGSTDMVIVIKIRMTTIGPIMTISNSPNQASLNYGCIVHWRIKELPPQSVQWRAFDVECVSIPAPVLEWNKRTQAGKAAQTYSKSPFKKCKLDVCLFPQFHSSLHYQHAQP